MKYKISKWLWSVGAIITLSSKAALGITNVVAWGSNTSGQTNVPAELSNAMAVAAGVNHSLALRADGTVVAWGMNTSGQTNVPIGLSNVVAVSGGGYHSLALRADGTVKAWGSNIYGQTNVPVGLSNVVAVSGGGNHSLALRADGTVVAWGSNSNGQTNVPVGISNVVTVSGGGNHSLALRTDGSVVAWGNNSFGQTNVPVGLSNVVAVAGGGNHSLAMLSVINPFLAPMVNQINAKVGCPIFLQAQPVGERPMRCQWQKDGIPLAWSTNALLMFAATNDNQSGSYCCIISNAQGVTTGSQVQITFIQPLAINVPPQNGAVFIGQNWAVSVGTLGSLPPRYQWQKDGQTLSAATSSTYNLSCVQLSDAGAYRVVVNDSSGGCLTSSVAQLSVRNFAVWGDSSFGQQTNMPIGLTNVVSMADGGCHSLALCADGKVSAWGYNGNGETIVPVGLTNAMAVSAGANYSLALRADGTVAAWGTDVYGQTNVPIGLSNVVAVSGGQYHSLALRADGTVVAWGSNSNGQTNVPVGLSNVVAVSGGGNYSLALRADGTVVAWGMYDDFTPTYVPAGLSNVVAVAAGGYHSLALCADGSVVAWGYNSNGQTNVPIGLSNVVAVAAGFVHSLALCADGTVVAWGWDWYGQTNVPVGLSNVVAASAGGFHSEAVVGVGKPFLAPMVNRINGQLGSPVFLQSRATGKLPMSCIWQKDGVSLAGSTNALLTVSAMNTNQSGNYRCIVSNVFGVTTGSVVSVTLTPVPVEMPNVIAWGANIMGQTNVPLGATKIVVVAGGGYHSLALRADGTVVAWGLNTSGQTNVPVGLSNVVAVAGGRSHSLALCKDGKVTAWGDNQYGQTNVPVGLSNVVAIAAGDEHNLAIRADGSVIAWGSNSSGQTNVPSGLSNVVAVAGGWYHSLALRADGSVVAWGYNSNGQTNVPIGLSNVVAVSGGSTHSLALRADGTVVSWGWMPSGQTNVPAGLNNVVSVAASDKYSLALRSDGTVVVWGRNDFGQTNVPVGLSNVVAASAGGFHSVAVVGVGKPFLAPMMSQVHALFGTSVFLKAQPSGQLPLTCVWQKDGIPLVTNALLVLPAVKTDQEGDYRCDVSNAKGMTTGTVVHISVDQPNVIGLSLQSASVFLGQSWVISVNAVGDMPMSFQWFKDGLAINGATSNKYVVSSTQFGDSGLYSVVVSNQHGAVTSEASQFNVRNVAVWGGDWGGQTDVPGGVKNVVAVSGGGNHSLALCADGSVKAWGYNVYGQATVPMGLSNVIAVSAGDLHSLALRADGSVVAWGNNAYGQATVPAGVSNVVAVAAGGYHSLALRADGTVKAWGYNVYGQATVPVGLSNVVAVAAGGYHNLALCADGTVKAWGYNKFGQIDVPEGLSNVIAVAGGENHSVALCADGTVAAWGGNTSGQTSVPAGLSNVVAVAGGESHSLALQGDGTVVGWGGNIYGQASTPMGVSNVVALAAGANHDMAAVGLDGNRPFLPPMVSQINTLYGIPVFLQARPVGQLPMNCYWQKDGLPLEGATNALLALTGMDSDQTGNYQCIVSNVQGMVTGALVHITYVQISISMPFQNGSIYLGQAWTNSPQIIGERPLNYQWQKDGLAIDGATSSTYVVSAVKFCDAGFYGLIVSNQYGSVTSITTKLSVGNVAAWGDNRFGQTVVPEGVSNAVAVAGCGSDSPPVPAAHSLALRSDGSVMAWGSNSSGQTNVPLGLNNVVAVVAGGGPPRCRILCLTALPYAGMERWRLGEQMLLARRWCLHV